KRRWKVAAQVAVQVRSLQILRAGQDSSARLDVGALLVRESDGGTREMLTGSMIRAEAGSAGGTLLYETIFDDLQPGEWTLRAFVLNRSVDQAGRSEVSIDLPKPGTEGFVGPLAAVPARNVYRSELTPRDGKEHGAAGVVVAPQVTFAPLGDAPVLRGQTLLISSWACSGPETPRSRSLVSFIERDGQPLFRVPDGESDGAAPCEGITSVVQTIELVPGEYTYRVAWKEPGEGALSDAAPPVVFSVVAGQAPAVATRR
ncbi:MAG TPA: hypothetical protein VNI57_05005, partial [Candidatus Saccharimonadales bacterium]|nr:hypothetical protein [Candidatus Saccharimonadales bacterium]